MLALFALIAATGGPMSAPALPEVQQDFAQSWSCAPRRICSEITTCEEANWYLANCSWGGKLDRDSDGIPCESICGSSR